MTTQSWDQQYPALPESVQVELRLIQSKLTNELMSGVYPDYLTTVLDSLDYLRMECSRAKAFPAQEFIEQLRQETSDILSAYKATRLSSISAFDKMQSSISDLINTIPDLIQEDIDRSVGAGPNF